jgi:hypothetical protein
MVLPVFAATKVPRDGGPNGAARHDNLWFTSATIKQSPAIQVPVVPLGNGLPTMTANNGGEDDGGSLAGANAKNTDPLCLFRNCVRIVLL